MSIDARSGPAHILASGEVTTFFGHDLRIGAQVAADVRYEVRFVFATDPAVDDVAVEATPDDDGITLRLVNFDKDDGRGSREPVLLGALGDDLLFLHFRVFRFGRSADHTVHFTFFRAARDDVGWRDGAPHG